MPILTLDQSLVIEDKYYQGLEPQFEKHLKKLGDSQYDWENKTITRSLVPICTDTQPENLRFYHMNYIDYLTQCWAKHYGVVVEPNHLWYTLLCELAAKVKANPEPFRHVFTTSQDKKGIIVPCDGIGFVIDMHLLLNELKKEVPTDTAMFFPEFTTNTYRSQIAKYAAFADMASPYYDYFMRACGFPAIDVRGTRDDWQLMANKWRDISNLFPSLAEWFERVQGVLDKCVVFYDHADWWKEMYNNKQCGSGSDVLVKGWFTDLFYTKCDFPKPNNFPPCVSIVDYTRINLHNSNDVAKFQMKHGLFYSRLEGDFLVPDFGYVLFNKLDEPETITPTFRQTQYSGMEWVARLEPESIRTSKKTYDKARKVIKDLHK